jgi:3-hydroxyacyl-[acyl-carrier-protein] dehydratase
MPRNLIFDPATLDTGVVVLDREAIDSLIPQRHEMSFLDAVHIVDTETGLAVGSRRIHGDEFWVRGHIPGRPLLPGVLSLEALAQLSSVYYKSVFREDDRFFGFGGVDGVKFRGTVVPGDLLVLVAKVTDLRPRRAVFDCQGMVEGRLVVEATITGLPM